MLFPCPSRLYVGYQGVEPCNVLLPKQAAHPEPYTRHMHPVFWAHVRH